MWPPALLPQQAQEHPDGLLGIQGAHALAEARRRRGSPGGQARL